MRTVTLRLLVYYIILAFLVWCLEGALASLLGPPRLLRSPKTFLLSYLHVVDGCAEKKGRRRMLYGQMAPDTHFSWSHHEGKMSLKVYNKFPDSLDAPKQFRKIRCQNRQPNFFHKTAPSSISRYYITSAPVASSGAIFIQLEANFPRPVSAFFQRT